ncbi:MAG: hypothetical protein ABIS17_13635 [Casimicrobiaceae bacterium]
MPDAHAPEVPAAARSGTGSAPRPSTEDLHAMAGHVPAHLVSKLDRAQLLSTLYQYLSQRLESLTHRCSLLLAVLASYLGFITSGLMHDGHTLSVDKLMYAVTHPSVLIGLAGIAVLAWAETGKIKRSDDLFAQLAFSDIELGKLHDTFNKSTIDELFGHMMANIRVVGGFVRHKVKLYNMGAMLFVVSICLYIIGF